MNEECIELFNKIYEEIDVLVEGTDPKVQRIPNITVNTRLKRIKKDLRVLDTKLFMNSKFLEGLLQMASQFAQNYFLILVKKKERYNG